MPGNQLIASTTIGQAGIDMYAPAKMYVQSQLPGIHRRQWDNCGLLSPAVPFLCCRLLISMSSHHATAPSGLRMMCPWLFAYIAESQQGLCFLTLSTLPMCCCSAPRPYVAPALQEAVPKCPGDPAFPAVIVPLQSRTPDHMQ